MVDSWINCVVCGYRYKAFISTCPNCGTYNVDQPRKHTRKIPIGVIAITVIAIVLTTYITISFKQRVNLFGISNFKPQNEGPELPSGKDSQKQPDLSHNTSSQPQNEKPELPSGKDLQQQQSDLQDTTSISTPSQSQNQNQNENKNEEPKPVISKDLDLQQQQQQQWLDLPDTTSTFTSTPTSSQPHLPYLIPTSSQPQTIKVYPQQQIFCSNGIRITIPKVVILNGSSTELCSSVTTTTTTFQPQNKESKSITIVHGDLMVYALQLINKDRADFGLPPVKLSINQAAQIHAEDVYRTKQISHWMTNGEKPHMTYTRYGGMGSVSQNIAVDGYTSEAPVKCESLLAICEKTVSTEEIKKLEHMLVYDDEKCCNNGHRDNILDPYHTHVSIGIAYDDYYFTMVQNFENNYGLHVSEEPNGQVMVSGQLARGTLEQIGIYYDEMPTPATYDLNKNAQSYSLGKLVALVVKPPQPGYYYEQPEGYSLIIANDWTIEQNNNSINVSFDLSQVMKTVKKDGVYTIVAFVKDNNGKIFEATSYSIFVKSDSTVR